MMEKEENKEKQNFYGDPLISWSIDEYPRHERSIYWYVVVVTIGVGLIIYSLLTANFLFAVIILMFGIISFLFGSREPRRIEVIVTDVGAMIGPTFYPFKEIRSFSVIYEPPEVKILYLDFHHSLRPLMSVPLEQTDPNLVRHVLSPYVSEDLKRTEESLTDMLTRMYKL